MLYVMKGGASPLSLKFRLIAGLRSAGTRMLQNVGRRGARPAGYAGPAVPRPAFALPTIILLLESRPP
jgi:hypothetical protein